MNPTTVFIASTVQQARFTLESIGAKAVEHHQATLRRKAAEVAYHDAWRDFQDYTLPGGERIKRGHHLFEDAVANTEVQYAVLKRAIADERNAAARLARAAGKVA